MTEIRKWMDLVESTNATTKLTESAEPGKLTEDTTDSEFALLLEADFGPPVIRIILSNAANARNLDRDELLQDWLDEGRPTDHREIIDFLKSRGLSKGQVYKVFKNSHVLGDRGEAGSKQDLSFGQRFGRKARELWKGATTSRNTLMQNPAEHNRVSKLHALIVDNDMTDDVVKYLQSVHGMKESYDITESKDILLTNKDIRSIFRVASAPHK